MRLLHTRSLEFREDYESSRPEYAILSHRWADPQDEVSYADFIGGRKRNSSGYAKITRFRELACEQGFDYCWVDTCCIDKSSSAELSEAINSMFKWYQDAAICIVFLADVDTIDGFMRSAWHTRGWTLQELIAPDQLTFVNSKWSVIGNRSDLISMLSSSTGIDGDVFSGERHWSSYSVAQRMSWAADRTTSRLEYQAYCLMGLFGVNMPLLYGEGAKAFRRLQKEILASDEDASLFAWDCIPWYDESFSNPTASLFAPSPASFRGSADIERGFSSQRIRVESTNRGFMLMIHRTGNQATLDEFLEAAHARYQGITIPLGCYRQSDQQTHCKVKGVYLLLALDGAKWRRVNAATCYDHRTVVHHQGQSSGVYDNNYYRLYIHDRLDYFAAERLEHNGYLILPHLRCIRFLNFRDTSDDQDRTEVVAWRCCKCSRVVHTGSYLCAHCCHHLCKDCTRASRQAEEVRQYSADIMPSQS